MSSGIRRSKGEYIGSIFIHILMVIIIFITLYPFIYVLSMSVSDPNAVLRQEVWLLPKGINFDAYKQVAQNSQLWVSYKNTIWYTFIGTITNIVLTVLAAYPLSRRELVGRRKLMFAIMLTMFFSGGMIPMFIVVNNLNIYDTTWAMVLPTAISTYNMVVARSFFESLPESLIESAKLDGANDFTILLKLILPLSKAILAVLTLFYAVTHWNTYMNALLYLPSADKQPLQIYLQKLLITLSNDAVANVDDLAVDRGAQAMQLRYASIIVTILPIVCIYPFLQKYFVQGVMIGAVKE